MNTLTRPLILQPGMGTELHAFGNILSVMLGGEQTGNMISVMLETTPPGGGPPLHVHSREEEIFLVIEGQISYCVDATWTEVRPGGVVYLPRGAAHCYRNTGLILRVKPTINTEGLLTLNISQEVSEIGTNPPGIDSPTILTRRINTNVVAAQGETIVLGELIFENKSKVVSKVAFLGDIPLLGYLFKTTFPLCDVQTDLHLA